MIKTKFRIIITYWQRWKGMDLARGTSNVSVVFHYRFIRFSLDIF